MVKLAFFFLSTAILVLNKEDGRAYLYFKERLNIFFFRSHKESTEVKKEMILFTRKENIFSKKGEGD